MKKVLTGFFLYLCVVFAFACSDKKVCVVGAKQKCSCPSGEGEQTCKADGSAWDTCVCPEKKEEKKVEHKAEKTEEKTAEVVVEQKPELIVESEVDGGVKEEAPPEKVGLPKGATCTPTDPCATGLLCTITDSANRKGICFVNCTDDSSLCGDETCVSLTSGNRICLKAVGVGEKCAIKEGTTCKRGEYPALYCSSKTETCGKVTLQENEGDVCSTDSSDDPPKRCDIRKHLVCDEASGQCQKAKVATTNEKCGVNEIICDASKQERCITMTSGSPHGYCFPPCKAEKDANCSGRCIRLRDQSYVCAPGGSKKTGEACGGENDVNAQVYDTSQSCKPNMVCLRASQDAPGGNCYNRCSSANDVACTGANGELGECRGLTSGGHYCRKFGKMKEDELCGQDPKSTSIDFDANCAKGLLCLRLTSSNPKGICSKYDSNGCANLQCGQGRVCLGLNSGTGACAKDCSADPKVCSVAKTSCEALGTRGSFCSPEPVYGPKGYGEACNTEKDVTTDGCKKGFLCQATKSDGTGFCSEDCTQSNTCKGVTNSQNQHIAGQCQQLQTSAVCFFPCSISQSSPCPDGLTCKKTKSGPEYCLP